MSFEVLEKYNKELIEFQKWIKTNSTFPQKIGRINILKFVSGNS
jgi:hypothetical protein